MSYFSKFPQVRYTFDDGKTNKIAIDILRKVGFKDSNKEGGLGEKIRIQIQIPPNPAVADMSGGERSSGC